MDHMEKKKKMDKKSKNRTHIRKTKNGKKAYNSSRTEVITQHDNDETTNEVKLIQRLSPLNSNTHLHILLWEILTPNDPRSDSKELHLWKVKEIVGVIEKVPFRVMLKQDLEDESNTLCGRFVLTIKHKESGTFQSSFSCSRPPWTINHSSYSRQQQTINRISRCL